jgi:predicted  nucleic acid-binding Zn-ribbon protein
VSLLHPRQVIPQAGVTDIDNMDYIFVMVGTTKQQVKDKFGVDVFKESEEYPEARSNEGKTERTADDMVTLITAYYRNKKGGIGVYRWVGDTEVQDLEDYYARRLRHCEKCGCVVSEDDTECPECGSKKFEYKNEDTTPLTRDITMNDGEQLNQMIDAEYQENIMFDDNYDQILDDYGNPITQQVEVSPARPNEVPVYKIKQYPIVLRKNISKSNSVMGVSDVDTMRDPQELMKKLGTKIQEKLLKGGSYAVLPKGANIRKDGGELNVIELDNVTDKQMIDVLNMQPNISNDVSYQENIYQSARQSIGITDAFQGRKDSSATSGTAKQFAAAQTAGRLESKRTMKQAAYQRLYELMFKFMLAFADEPRPTTQASNFGKVQYGIFDRYDFLERDDNGELYFNDDFLFSIDSTNNLAQNREAMWDIAKENFANGAFGDVQDINTQIIYWNLLDKYHYPAAKDTLSALMDRKEQQEEMARQQATQQQNMINGGGTNAMPTMQNRNVPVQNQGQQISSGLPQSQMRQLQ